tara:strand:+ start:144 stop:263 length:120 start_codon:yes stop_codon:yes gene_type:complete
VAVEEVQLHLMVQEDLVVQVEDQVVLQELQMLEQEILLQ